MRVNVRKTCIPVFPAEVGQFEYLCLDSHLNLMQNKAHRDLSVELNIE